MHCIRCLTHVAKLHKMKFTSRIKWLAARLLCVEYRKPVSRKVNSSRMASFSSSTSMRISCDTPGLSLIQYIDQIVYDVIQMCSTTPVAPVAQSQHNKHQLPSSRSTTSTTSNTHRSTRTVTYHEAVFAQNGEHASKSIGGCRCQAWQVHGIGGGQDTTRHDQTRQDVHRPPSP